MKPIKIDLPRDLDAVELHALSDWHLGDLNCDYKHIEAELEHIATTPNAYAILAGDLCNNATTASISDTYSERISPMEQINKAVQMLRPIKDKLLCATTGNHCERTYKQDGIDITRLICRELGIEQNYREDFCFVFLSFGCKSRRASEGRRQTYTIYVNHGSRGGRKIGGKANALSDLSCICDADIFFVAHTHSPIVFKDAFIRSTGCSGGIDMVERVFINTAASLDYGGYSARQGYAPSSKSNPVALLSGHERKIDVKI